jgi:predicted Zn finger-like uncharacterized protein
MAEIISCPQCERKLRATDDLLGKQVKCPTCGTTFTAEMPRPPVTPIPIREEDRPGREERRPPRRPPAGRRDDRDEDDWEDPGPLGPPPAARSRRGMRRDAVPHRGPLILVLGILSLVFCWTWVMSMVLGPIAWIMGHNDLKEMRAGRMDSDGQGMTNAGMICGIISTLLAVLMVAGCFLNLLGSFSGD